MAKKNQGLKPDVILKDYWRNNEQFADLCNAVLFDGKEVIKPGELEDMDTEESSVLEHRGHTQSIKAARDNLKIRKKSTAYGIQLTILGLENQEHIHYAMPLRVMGYDYSAYKKQYDSNAGKYKTPAGLGADEYLTKMKKTDKFTPVITIVIYYGETPWDGAVTLHDMLDIPSEVAEYVNDYRMILIEARNNRLSLCNGNNIDLFNLFRILLDKSRLAKEIKNRAIEYTKEHRVNRNVIMTVAGTVNTSIDYNALDEEDGGNKMITVFKETMEEGRAEGIKEGIKEGRASGIIETGLDCGLSETDILEKLQEKLNISLQMAQQYYERFGTQAE